MSFFANILSEPTTATTTLRPAELISDGGFLAWLVFVTCVIGTPAVVLIAVRLPEVSKEAELILVKKFSNRAKDLSVRGVVLPALYTIPPFLYCLVSGDSLDTPLTVLAIIIMFLSTMSACSAVSTFGGRALEPQVVMLMTYGFCIAAGFQAFTFSAVVFPCGFAVLFGMVSVSIRFNRASWDAKEPEELEKPEDDNVGEDGESCLHKVGILHKLGLFAGLPTRLVNFVLQVTLVTYSMGDLWGVFGLWGGDGLNDVTWEAKSFIKTHLEWTYDSVVVDLPGVGHFVSIVGIASAFLNDASEHATAFLLNFSRIWTTNWVTGYVVIAVFEICIVAAAFIIVLSDVLLIVSPRDGTGCLGRLAGDYASRALLYVLQALASASQALLLPLCFLRRMEGAAAWDEDWVHILMTCVGVPVTCFYVVLTLFTAANILSKLWSGCDAGLQNLGVTLLKLNGIEVSDVSSNKDFRCAFILAFLGIWPQRVLDAFEVEQRMRTYCLEEEDVLLSTVNALSFPLYLIPFGTVVAKLGEYLNQNPIYVESKGFSWLGLLITLTYVAEYVLVLIAAWQTLDSVEFGTPEEEDITGAAQENGHSLKVVLLCLLAITTVRQLLEAIRDSFSKPTATVQPCDGKANEVQIDEEITANDQPPSSANENPGELGELTDDKVHREMHQCNQCGDTFASRNKLFKHIRESGHHEQGRAPACSGEAAAHTEKVGAIEEPEV